MLFGGMYSPAQAPPGGFVISNLFIVIYLLFVIYYLGFYKRVHIKVYLHKMTENLSFKRLF